MIYPADCQKKYGNPYKDELKYMVLWDVPTDLELGVIPNRLYCNMDMVKPLAKVFRKIIDRGCLNESTPGLRPGDILITWDGCFNIRKMKGSDSLSLHSWGVAVDINAAWNGFGVKPTMGGVLVSCFTEEGFDWGGKWSKPDGMHFQLSKI